VIGKNRVIAAIADDLMLCGGGHECRKTSAIARKDNGVCFANYSHVSGLPEHTSGQRDCQSNSPFCHEHNCQLQSSRKVPVKSGIVTTNKLRDLLAEANELVAIFAASRRTARA
jgi:hypothetical protein